MISAGTAEAAAVTRGGRLDLPGPLVRGVWVEGANGRRYGVIANFSDDSAGLTALGHELVVQAQQEKRQLK